MEEKNPGVMSELKIVCNPLPNKGFNKKTRTPTKGDLVMKN